MASFLYLALIAEAFDMAKSHVRRRPVKRIAFAFIAALLPIYLAGRGNDALQSGDEYMIKEHSLTIKASDKGLVGSVAEDADDETHTYRIRYDLLDEKGNAVGIATSYVGDLLQGEERPYKAPVGSEGVFNIKKARITTVIIG